MGCDIHANFEIKVDNEWLYYSEPDINRNYKLFSRMAGVRNNGDIEPISEPRGLPENVTKTTKLKSDWMGSDGHSHSYLSSLEVIKLIGEFEFELGELGYLDGKGWENPKTYPKGLEDFRLVFWFDN